MPGPESRPVLDLDDVSRTYPGPPPVAALKGCTLRVDPGDYVAVVGPSGSGKSTLLNLLGLLDRPTTGTYRLDGVETSSLSESQRAAVRGSWIGFVFQSFHLLPHRSAAENVALGQLYAGAPHRGADRSARELLDRVGLGARADALPTQLSGGERQRVAIARALVHGPSLLLCDEPTGNLDQATAATVLDLIDELHAQAQTVVVITHDLEVASRAGRLLTLRDGRLSESS